MHSGSSAQALLLDQGMVQVLLLHVSRSASLGEAKETSKRKNFMAQKFKDLIGL